MVKPKIQKRLNEPVEDIKVKPPAKVVKEIKPPVALKPGVNWDSVEAEVTSPPLDSPNPDWDKILQDWGYDPNIYEVVEPLKVSAWDAQNNEGEIVRLYSFKAGIRTKARIGNLPDYQELVREIKRHRKPKQKAPSGKGVFVVCFADWQLSKGDNDGTQGTVNRILTMIDNVEQRIKNLRKIGRDLGTLVVAGMGDIIENCSQNYSAQPFLVELNRREQIRVARRLVRDALVKWSKLFEEVVVLAVPGNHGENRMDGKLYTTYGDNDDVAVFEMVGDILSANKEVFGHIKFYLPEDEISMVLDLDGIGVGFAHGHITSGGGSMPQAKIRKWWEGQVFGNRTVGDAKILVTAHYHHFSIVEFGERIHIQCPSMDGGSEWWENLSGEASRPGTLTFVVDKNSLSGYTDLEVI